MVSQFDAVTRIWRVNSQSYVSNFKNTGTSGGTTAENFTAGAALMGVTDAGSTIQPSMTLTPLIKT